MRVDVELPPLGTRHGRGVSFIDCCDNAVDVENAGEDQPAETCTDNGNLHGHTISPDNNGTAFHIGTVGTSFHTCQWEGMTRKNPSKGRHDALSKGRIIETAISILDLDGVNGLTFRALAARLETGSGAIYWHVADKHTLLAAATDHVIAGAMAALATQSGPQDTIRAVALGAFGAMAAHSWIGAQLASDPWQRASLRILERLGREVQAVGIPADALFNPVTALMNCILGVAAQHAAASQLPRDTERSDHLAAIAARWAQLDPVDYAFVRALAAQLPGHDDRAQFLAGVNLVLVGVESIR
jgi:AcrR family transcriptional regulator